MDIKKKNFFFGAPSNIRFPKPKRFRHQKSSRTALYLLRRVTPWKTQLLSYFVEASSWYLIQTYKAFSDYGTSNWIEPLKAEPDHMAADCAHKQI